MGQFNPFENNGYSKRQTDELLSKKADLVNGLIPLNQIPPATMEHMVTVANDTARFALTKSEVQNGDTVYVDSSTQMYMVVDDERLDSETGYKAYAAGTATRAIADKDGNDITTEYAKKVLTGYAADTAESSITSTTTVQEAAEQLDYRTTTNKNNLLLIEKANGAKNLLKYDGLSRTTHNGVSFTINADLSITATRVESSSSTATTELTLNGNYIYIDDFCDNNHYLTGCPTGGGSTTFEEFAKTSGSSDYIRRDYGEGVLLTSKGTNTNIMYQFAIHSGFTGSITFKPMIITKLAYDAGFTDYQPYALPNSDLTTLSIEDRAALVELVDSGAKNALDLTKATSVSVGAGISYTLAADGILAVTWEGLTSGKTLKFKGLPYISGTLILSGVQSLSDPTVFRADVRQGETPETRTDIRTMDYGESPKESFTMLSDVYDYVIRIDVPSGESSTSGTVTLKPMICSKAAWDISQAYVPHCPTEDEQNVQIATNTSAIADIFGLPSTSIAPGSDETDDFNNYMIGGRYKVTSSTYGVRIQNNPYPASSGVLKVEIIQSENYVRQEYYVQAHPESLYVRHYRYTNGWTNWFVFTATEIIPSA